MFVGGEPPVADCSSSSGDGAISIMDVRRVEGSLAMRPETRATGVTYVSSPSSLWRARERCHCSPAALRISL